MNDEWEWKATNKLRWLSKPPLWTEGQSKKILQQEFIRDSYNEDGYFLERQWREVPEEE